MGVYELAVGQFGMHKGARFTLEENRPGVWCWRAWVGRILGAFGLLRLDTCGVATGTFWLTRRLGQGHEERVMCQVRSVLSTFLLDPRLGSQGCQALPTSSAPFPLPHLACSTGSLALFFCRFKWFYSVQLLSQLFLTQAVLSRY